MFGSRKPQPFKKGSISKRKKLRVEAQEHQNPWGGLITITTLLSAMSGAPAIVSIVEQGQGLSLGPVSVAIIERYRDFTEGIIGPYLVDWWLVRYFNISLPVWGLDLLLITIIQYFSYIRLSNWLGANFFYDGIWKSIIGKIGSFGDRVAAFIGALPVAGYVVVGLIPIIHRLTGSFVFGYDLRLGRRYFIVMAPIIGALVFFVGNGIELYALRGQVD